MAASPPSYAEGLQDQDPESFDGLSPVAEADLGERQTSVDLDSPSGALASPVRLDSDHQNHQELKEDETVETPPEIDQAIEEDVNEDNNEDLTPPPDSPIEDTMSDTSSVPPNDEIVVGTNAHRKTSPVLAAEPEDIVMEEAEQRPASALHSKRKRASGIYADSPGDKDVSPAPTEDSASRPRPARPVKGHGAGQSKGVELGYWRDSPPNNEAEKHRVTGFIDVRDRLRTRIIATTREDTPVDQKYPIPPGPGGSWVTFDKVAFDAHLVGHNHHVIKEYVKVRNEISKPDETPEEKAKLSLEAAEIAIERVKTNPPPDAATAPLIAYGPEIPANAIIPSRPETKKRRLAGSFGIPSDTSSPNQPALDPLLGTRPTRILVGYWNRSSEPDPINKHAVFGILGANDMFRVKLARETRDGRTVNGNFPGGPGALWIHWDDVVFEPHLRGMTRQEIKEYCRIRQYQIDHAADWPQPGGARAHELARAEEIARLEAAQARADIRAASREASLAPGGVGRG
ncbi:hypothetical protein N0V88_000355 [Collariella sp. IMI 366227]|nr:hypothetical protein N0V88_000355 [Collariella sp. IMI 366227]